MSSHDDRPDLDQEQTASLPKRTSSQGVARAREESPAPGSKPGAQAKNELRSPIRPTLPEAPRAQDPRLPEIPLPPTPARPMTPREQMQRAEEALILLREKMSQIAAEFADGKLNRDQFQAVYGRYSEQRDITERLLARDPNSQAWQSVITAGHTAFLIEHYAARVLSYAIYDQATGTQITISGSVQIAEHQVKAVLDRLRTVMAERGNPGPAQKRLADGSIVLIVPGDLTTAIVVYSREPSAHQIARVVDLQADFERANNRALLRRDYAHSRLVFPHRALFDDPGQT